MLSSDPVTRSVEGDLQETRDTLNESARRRFGAIPGAALVDHVLSMTEGADFPVREAALEALERRFRFAARDGLCVATSPARGVIGAYTTARKESDRKSKKSRAARGHARPYTSFLSSVSPPRGNCGCPDFLRSSLGLCKHLLVVLQHVHSSKNHRALVSLPAQSRAPMLVWNAGLPLHGPLDRLQGLRLEGVSKAAARQSGELRIERLFAGESPHRSLGRAIDPRLLDDAKRRRHTLTVLQEATDSARKHGASLLASPAARALIVEEIERVERRLRCELSADSAATHLHSLKRKLYPYQRAGIERFLRVGRLLLADDMGLGKTTQAIASCHALFHARRVRRGLVITPASLKPQWLREWNETSDVPVAIVDGSPAERARQYRKLDAGFLIINYEQLLRDFERVHALGADIVVLDEAQRIKNYATKSAAYVKVLAPEYRLVLTGTPMENRLEELASILDWVDDIALAPKWRIVPWHSVWAGDGGNTGKAGARNLDTLRARIEPCVMRRLRRDVLTQLPARTDTRLSVEMTSQQVEEHDTLIQPIAQLVAIAKRRPLTQTQFLRLMTLLSQQRMISNGLGQVRFEELWPLYSRARPDQALLEGLFAPKLLEFRRLVSDLVLAQDRKVVVFSQWRRMLRLAEWSVRDVLGDENLKAVFFTGAERPAQRTQSIVDFHDDPRVRVMFLSDAGGVGLNLQRAASACINLELPWNPAVLEQRIGRIYRLGQRSPIDVFNLVSEYGIESRIASLISTKQALFSGVFDSTSNEVRFDSAASFLTRVERLLEPTVAAAPSISSSSALLAPEIDDADGPSGDDGDHEEREPSIPTMIAADGAESEPSARVRAGAAMSAPTASAAGSPADLLRSLRVERTAEGGIRIEAPPHAASSLAAMFLGMAQLLGSVGGGASGETERTPIVAADA